MDYLEIIDNRVYIKKSIFDNVEFIKNIVKDKASLICRDFEVPSSEDEVVESLKFPIIDLLYEIGIPVDFIFHTSYTGSGENSVLVPAAMKVISNIEYYEFLSKKEVDYINNVFGMVVLNNIEDCTSPKHLPVSGNGGVYGIDFYDEDISYCVLNKIIENSLINARHELSIDPELRFRALSPAQSPLNSPTHAGPSGLRTPPNQRNRDSGYDSNSPPKPKDSVAPSTSGGPRSSVEQSRAQGFPTRSQDGALEDSPRRGSEKSLLHNSVNLAGTSKGFPPLPQLNSIAVSYGVSGPSKSGGNLGAAAASGSIPGFSSWSQSGASSSKGAGKNMLTGSSPWCLPPSTSSLTTRNDSISSNFRIFADPPEDTENICSMKEKQQVTKEKEEEKLSKALLYTFNLMNYTLDGVYTNFFAKDGKIVSLLHDNVDRKKYFQEVRAYIIEEYCETEEEARKVYDLDEFPFKLNCEEKQGKTVVANISSGALSNLKILFNQKFGKNVDAIDISVVKKVEKREKDEWVDDQLSNGDSLEEACKGCFPDEGAMKIIPIAFEGGEYVLDRSRDTCEVNLLFKEQLRRFRGTSLEKRKSSDKPLTEEEEKLSKALLYWFNFNNYVLDPPHTNFIVENGKIASLIDDSVNVKEYLQEVIDKTKEEYRVNKKEAYDLNEFPFKFPSNCEKNQKNQETTVVANISSGALLNLKKLFIQEHKKKVEIKDIDINIVEKDVKSKKNLWVDDQVRDGTRPDVALKNSCPDESELEHIPITKDKGGYWLNRTYKTREVKLFLEERQRTKGTSVAKKGKLEDNKDSGIGSENATSDCRTESEPMDYQASSHVQQQNPWSEDEGSSRESSRSSSNSSSKSDGKNTERKPLKRRSPSSEGSPTRKSLRSESGNSSSEKAGGPPRSNLSDYELCKQFREAGISKG